MKIINVCDGSTKARAPSNHPSLLRSYDNLGSATRRSGPLEFLGIFGGCVGGIYVHHLYSKWKKEHPDGTMNDFVSENKDHLPAGWADRLSTVGETSDLRAGNAPHKQ